MSDPVLVVGSGPVGLTMALELARYRVPVRLVDKMTERSDKSRAIAVWTRTLELLDRADVSRELLGRGNKVSAAHIVSGGETIARIALKDVESPYPFVLMIPQSDTESILERRIQDLGVKTEMDVELTSFTQDAEGVTGLRWVAQPHQA
jgi:2-polyprenyl-6-methoxyphenol hydroxylase-like FAD-dependent oxidoreductase